MKVSRTTTTKENSVDAAPTSVWSVVTVDKRFVLFVVQVGNSDQFFNILIFTILTQIYNKSLNQRLPYNTGSSTVANLAVDDFTKPQQWIGVIVLQQSGNGNQRQEHWYRSQIKRQRKMFALDEHIEQHRHRNLQSDCQSTN